MKRLFLSIMFAAALLPVAQSTAQADDDDRGKGRWKDPWKAEEKRLEEIRKAREKEAERARKEWEKWRKDEDKFWKEQARQAERDPRRYTYRYRDDAYPFDDGRYARPPIVREFRDVPPPPPPPQPYYRDEGYNDGRYYERQPTYRYYDDALYAPRHEQQYYYDDDRVRRGADTGARIGARIGGSLFGPEGARIGAGIGSDIGAEVERR